MRIIFCGVLVCAAVFLPLDLRAQAVQPVQDDADVTPSETAAEKIVGRSRDIGVEGDDINKDAPLKVDADEVKSMDLWFYGSARLRTTGSDGDLAVSDNRSRVGVAGYKFILPEVDLFTRIELGTDVGGTINDLIVPPENARQDSGSVFLRIGKVGVGTRYGEFSLGKQWSVYYDVAGYTDRFVVYGAQGTGIYNAGTDGGGSGTGRADRAFKYESPGSRLSVGAQVQADGTIPLSEGVDYDGGGGASLSYEFSERWTAGAAYNHAFIDDLTPELQNLGLTGDAQAGTLGVQYAHEPIYVAFTASRLENQVATNEQKYVDADGAELYARYSFDQRLRAIGGFNYLDPDGDDASAGDYKVENYILGLQYTYGTKGFGDLVYFEAEFRSGRDVDGSKQENAYTIGIRWSFEL